MRDSSDNGNSVRRLFSVGQSANCEGAGADLRYEVSAGDRGGTGAVADVGGAIEEDVEEADEEDVEEANVEHVEGANVEDVGEVEVGEDQVEVEDVTGRDDAEDKDDVVEGNLL